MKWPLERDEFFFLIPRPRPDDGWDNRVIWFTPWRIDEFYYATTVNPIITCGPAFSPTKLTLEDSSSSTAAVEAETPCWSLFPSNDDAIRGIWENYDNNISEMGLSWVEKKTQNWNYRRGNTGWWWVGICLLHPPTTAASLIRRHRLLLLCDAADAERLYSTLLLYKCLRMVLLLGKGDWWVAGVWLVGWVGGWLAVRWGDVNKYKMSVIKAYCLLAKGAKDDGEKMRVLVTSKEWVMVRGLPKIFAHFLWLCIFIIIIPEVNWAFFNW